MNSEASIALIISFIGLVALVMLALLKSVQVAAQNGGRDARADLKRAAVLLLGWLGLTGALGLAGVFMDFSFPPPLPLLLVVSLGVTVWLGASRYGAHLAQHMPLWILVGINAFRLPLELLMHEAYLQGVMPIQMSYSGQNYDIMTGASAIIVAGMCFTGPPPQRIVRVFNIFGIVMLINVLVIAVLSMPLPLRMYMNEPANTWVGTFPFVWLPAFLVLTAVLSHVLILRRLVSEISIARHAFDKGRSRR